MKLRDESPDEPQFDEKILEKLSNLDVDRLMSVALTDKSIVLELFKRKYAQTTIEIRNIGKSMQIANGKLIINHQTAESAIKLFGHLINTTIIINYMGIKQKEATRITDSISKYCKHLTNMVFIDFEANPFSGTQTDFPTVNVVYLIGKSTTFGTKNYKLNQIFPNLRELHLLVQGIKDQSCIDLEFPFLEHLSTCISKPKFPSFDESTIEELLKKNPQIESAEFELVSHAFLKKVNEILPKLEMLKTTPPADEIDFFNGIRFKNVKKLTLKAMTDEIPSNIVFNQLENVVFDSDRSITKQ